jgi:hypothetical protein
MIDQKVKFIIEERLNNYRKTGKEWVLKIRIGNTSAWAIQAWEKKPCERTIDDVKDIVIRSFQIYHANLRIPRFGIEVLPTLEGRC